MPKGSPIIQAAFHSIGELLYKVVHFYDYWIQDSTKIIYSLPVRGDWLVANGGETPETSHSYDIINQRYALDFVLRQDILLYSDYTYLKPANFLSYGSSIFAPADGTVFLVQNSIPDSEIIGEIDRYTYDFRGNFVVIKHSSNEYSFLLHFIPGSISVAPGNQVKRGQFIGRCGNSGHSTQPHLHFHIQNTPIFHYGKGLKVNFDTQLNFLNV